MTERHYSDEEVAAIFKQAAELEHATLPTSAERSGTTLAALQEIGREVGLSPASISGAARALDLAGRPATRKFLGLPIGVGRTVEFDRTITEPEWEALVADLRNTFAAPGTVRYDGPFRQWANGNLRVLLEPTRQGHRLRLQTVKGNSLALMGTGSVMLGAAAVTLAAFAIAGTLYNTGIIAGMGILALSGGAMFAAGAAQVSGWAGRRRVQFEEVVARLGKGFIVSLLATTILLGCAAEAPIQENGSAIVPAAPPLAPALALIDAAIPLATAGEDGWNFQQSTTGDITGDGQPDRVVLTARVELMRGQPAWDDGQPWQVYVEPSGGSRTYLYAQRLQLGTLTMRLSQPDSSHLATVILLEQLPDRMRILEASFPTATSAPRVVLQFERMLDARGEIAAP